MTGSFDTPTSGNDRSFGGSDRDRINDDNETEIIAADIRMTQERLGDTVEEIGERFNPTRLKEELKHDIRDATIGKVENMAQQTAEMMSDAQHTIVQSIRENPIPVVLVGLGLGWMILNATSRNKQTGSSRSQYDDGQRWGSESRYGDQQRRGWSTTFEDQDRDYDQDYYRQQGSGVMDRARSKASDVVDSVKEKTSELADQTQHVASRVADQTRNQTRRVERAFQDSPLVIGAAALALGLAAGLAIPATEKEAELVGDTRDHLMDKVRDVAEDTKSKVQQVAERVIDQAETTAKDSAHEVGLMS